MPKSYRSLLPTAEEAVSLERAARCELIRRKLRRLQSGQESPRTEKEGLQYLLECFHRDGHL